MALVEWRDDFRTGIADVDFEHREIIKLINDAHERIKEGAPDEEIEAFLGEVYAGIAGHFALEESIMRERAYDQYDAHKEDHERLLDVLRDIMESFSAGAFDSMSEDLGRRLEDWFVQHFKSQDSRLHRMVGRF